MHACLERQPEASMLRTVLLVAILPGAPAVYAETATPDSESGRFTFHHVQDDVLRLGHPDRSDLDVQQTLRRLDLPGGPT
jgi:hypothetical protein